MPNKTIALDLDNVVFNTITITDEFVKAKFGIPPLPYTHYDFKQYPPQVAKAILDFYLTPDSCLGELYHDGFPVFYDYLKANGYKIQFVSSRRPNLLSATIGQFKLAGMNIPAEDISLVASINKEQKLRELNPVAFVDDSPTTVLGAAADANLKSMKIGLVSNRETIYNHFLRNHPRLIVGNNVVDVLTRALINEGIKKVR